MHHLQTHNFYAIYGAYITSNPPISHIFLVNFCIGQLLPGHEAVKKLSVVGCQEREPGLRGKNNANYREPAQHAGEEVEHRRNRLSAMALLS